MVAVNGRFHWEAYDTANICRNLIAIFDVNKEVFAHIKLPNLFGIHPDEHDDDDDEGGLSWELVLWKEDFLGMITHPKFGSGRYFDIWVLDEYGVEKSWTKHFTFGHHMDVHRPLACKSNGEILLYNYKGQLVVYDSATRTFKIVPVPGNPFRGEVFRGEVFNYVGTLLPIEGGSTIEEASLAAVEPDPFFVR